jgi:hypothetical protein
MATNNTRGRKPANGNTSSTKQNKTAEKAVNENKTATTNTETKTKKKKLKFDDNVLISVRSNVFGELIYINHKSGDEVKWNNFGDAQTLSVGDLRAMKAKQLSFFKENWVTIDGIDHSDDDYEDVKPEEIYDALQITQYYADYLCPKDINKIFNWSVEDLKNKIPRMTNSVRETIAVRANELISQGILDSMTKIKALEDILKCELISYNE